MTFRTTFRETLSSRQINLIDLPCTKNARRIFAIVSKISIPTSASKESWKPAWTPQPRGPDWMPITPKTGSLFHAETQSLILGEAKLTAERMETTAEVALEKTADGFAI